MKRDSTIVDVKDSHSGFPSANALKCFLYNRVGHRAIDCRVKPEGGRKKYNRPTRHAETCCQCGEIGHEKRFCGNTPRPQPVPWGGRNALGLRHNHTELDALRKLEHYRMMPKRRTKNFLSSNRREN